LTEAEKHFFFVGMVRGYGFDLFDRKFSGLGSTTTYWAESCALAQRVVTVERMCARAEAERYGSRQPSISDCGVTRSRLGTNWKSQWS